MSIQLFSHFMAGLLAVSLFTTLTVQGIKAILKEIKKDVPSNILASIVSIVLAVALSVGYAIMTNAEFSASYVVITIALAFTGWLCATNGYDKVKQAIEQVFGGK